MPIKGGTPAVRRFCSYLYYNDRVRETRQMWRQKSGPVLLALVNFFHRLGLTRWLWTLCRRRRTFCAVNLHLFRGGPKAGLPVFGGRM